MKSPYSFEMNNPWWQRRVYDVYSAGLNLYPYEFRERQGHEMLFCARQMLAESKSLVRTTCTLAVDFARSLLKEHLAMTLRPAALPQLAMLFTLTTFIAGTGYLISQQVLRMSANDPQIQMSEDAAQRLTDGENPGRVVPERTIDMASSLAPFLIVYDGAGQAIASSGKLDGTIPVPPKGVFDYVRSHGQESLTWQPRPGVRIASVIHRTANGFVVAGRNMREVESREDIVLKLAALGWLSANLALAVLWLLAQFLGRAQAPGLTAPA